MSSCNEDQRGTLLVCRPYSTVLHSTSNRGINSPSVSANPVMVNTRWSCQIVVLYVPCRALPAKGYRNTALAPCARTVFLRQNKYSFPSLFLAVTTPLFLKHLLVRWDSGLRAKACERLSFVHKTQHCRGKILPESVLSPEDSRQVRAIFCERVSFITRWPLERNI